MTFLNWFFDTSGFPARWRCGSGWLDEPWLGWLHIFSDLGVWSAYLAIPLVLGYFILRKKDLPFRKIFLLFGAFILACGTTHVMEAIIFWWPNYRLAGVIKLFTAVVSWATVIALVPVVPRVLAMRSPEELEREIEARKKADQALQDVNRELERRIASRTAELATANGVLQQERERFCTTLACIGDAVIATDTEGRVTFLNAMAQTLTGWTEEESQGTPLETVFKIVNEDTRQPVENPAVRALNEGAIVGLANHTVLVAKDGTERLIDDSAAPIRNSSGQLAGAVLVFRDITERKQSEARERSLLKEAAAANAKFRAFFEQGTLFTGILDLQGTLIEPNRLCYEGCGYRKEEVLGKAFWNGPWWTPASTLVDRIKEAFGQAAAGFTYQAEMPYFLADGSERIVDLTMLPIKDEAGRVQYVASSGTDITDRKLAEEQLRQSEVRFRTLFESMDEAFCIVEMIYDADNRPIDYQFLETNPTFEKHTGLKDAVGRTIRQLVPEHDSHWFETYDRVAATGEPVRFVNEAKATGRWYDVHAHRVGGPDGRRVGILFSDITASKQSDDDLRQMARALSEADRRKDEFLATLAHELRNPLAPICNGLQLMRLSTGNGSTHENARSMIERQLAQMVRLVDDLMDVSRISRGTIELRKTHLPLDEVINNAIETSRPLIEEMGHKLTVTLLEQPVLIEADLTRLAQVFSNLLNNAAKYSDRSARIWLAVELRGNEVLISVRDEGIGIAAGDLPHIFEMFSQVDRSLEKSRGGLGVGLTLVKRLVEMHGGAVEVQSEGLGKGAEFVVKLPAVRKPAAQASAGPEAGGKTASALRILIVDDNRDGANSLAMILKVMGNTTHTAYDGEEAVASAEAVRPDVILLDLGLPKLNGYEACRRIREQPWAKNLVIIAQTGWGQDGDRQRTHEAGFDYHLVKPVEFSSLMNVLANLPRSAV
ncbi:MAG TPA: PAS domain S-box protein [Pirellulales bacterium]|nr:PAS domain S-box protein [Pirellulales bacterium]